MLLVSDRLTVTERLRILTLLRGRPRSTSDLAVTPSAVSQHLQLLRRTALADSYRRQAGLLPAVRPGHDAY